MELLINTQRLLKTFCSLAEISSPSWKEEKVIAYIQKYLKSIGIKSKRLPCGKSHNLFASVKGTRDSVPVLFSCHTDTVTPCAVVRPVIQKDRVASDGTSILGSDDKCAVAMFLEALTVIQETNAGHSALECIFSCAEEIGLWGIKGFDLSLIQSKDGYVFDSGGPVGSIILAAPYHAKMDVTIIGKAAHAGIEPEKGINAITALSEFITTLPQGRIDAQTTFNVGTISGGSATNIVPAEACCQLEFRSLQKSHVAALKKEVIANAKMIQKKYRVKVLFSYEQAYPGFSVNKDSAAVKRAAAALKKIGIQPRFVSSGGGSDTNIFQGAGINAVNLSCGMQNVHTTAEFILIKDLIDGCRLALELMTCGDTPA